LQQSGLPAGDRLAYERAILSFLRLCKARHAPATVVLVRLHLQSHPDHRMALRWFFKAAGWRGTAKTASTAPAAASPQSADGPAENKRMRSNEPGLAIDDLGREPWAAYSFARGGLAYRLRHAAVAIGAH
jgi:hypothetical protein